MTQNVVGYFDSYSEADRAVRHLQTLGYTNEDISIIARDQAGEGRSDTELNVSDEGDDEPVGAGKGAVVGGITGLVVGIGALMIPGIGPVIAAGPLAAVIGTGAGALSGAIAAPILDSLMNNGVPREHAERYMEGIKRGGVLVTVHADDDDVDEVSDALNRYGACDVDERVGMSSDSSTDQRSTSTAALGSSTTGISDAYKQNGNGVASHRAASPDARNR